MKPLQEILDNPAIRLTRQDIIAFEHHLKDALQEFLPFRSHSLHFPQSIPEGIRTEKGLTALYLAEERRTLIPLSLGGEVLGLFVARGAALRAPTTMAALLPRAATQCLEKLQFLKASQCDPLTGLKSRNYFLRRASDAVAGVADCINPASGGLSDCPLPAHAACCGILVVRFGALPRIIRENGYEAADRAVRAVTARLREICPAQAVNARLDEKTFAVLLPEGTHRRCAQLGQALLALDDTELTDTILEKSLSPDISVGFANYPQDLSGPAFEAAPGEQSRILLERAVLAADTARRLGGSEAFAYPRVLAAGGIITGSLPMNRLTVSLGRSAGARENDRFLVWDADTPLPESPDASMPGCKGEIVLVRLDHLSARAEILQQTDVSLAPEPGDRLILLPRGHELDTEAGAPGIDETDAVTGLLSYREFTGGWSEISGRHERFTLALLRVNGASDADTAMAEAVELIREAFVTGGSTLHGGRIGLNSALLFHPDTDPEKAVDAYRSICSALTERGYDAACGLACHPFLNYRKADALENCRKALDYAVLLDPPHVGMIDSLALNIRADRIFAQGDVYGAIEEYKLALLADQDNNLARNSLGISLAGLDRLAEAARCFEDVLSRDPADVMALYNAGNVALKSGDIKGAGEFYRRCLEHNPGHLWSSLRLGQIAERDKSWNEARRHYLEAARQEGGEALTRTALARLAVRRERPEEARELLHQALVHNPHDAYALHLLATLCLDAGEDAEIAETLARQSVAIRPYQKAYWMTLARAFETGGKKEEATQALTRAAEL